MALWRSRHLYDRVITSAKMAIGAITTDLLAVGVLSADAAGRVLMAANYFDGATVIDKFQNGSIPNSVLQNPAFEEMYFTIPGGNGAGKVGDLFSAPVTVLNSFGPNRAIIIDEVRFHFGDYSATAWTAYDAAGAGDDLVLRYVGGAAAELTADVDNGNGGGIRLARAGAGDDFATVGRLVADTIPQANVGVELYCRTGDPFGAAGDMPITVELRFHVVNL